MRTILKEIKVYKFDNAPENVKQNIRDNIAHNWDLYDHCMHERVQTLEALANILQGTLDYSLSCVPDRGEYITIKPKYDSLYFDAITELPNECPLTGVCYDEDILYTFRHNLTIEGLNDALNKYIASIHSEYESMLDDDYIADMCEANEYEFTENGKLYQTV